PEVGRRRRVLLERRPSVRAGGVVGGVRDDFVFARELAGVAECTPRAAPRTGFRFLVHRGAPVLEADGSADVSPSFQLISSLVVVILPANAESIAPSCRIWKEAPR